MKEHTRPTRQNTRSRPSRVQDDWTTPGLSNFDNIEEEGAHNAPSDFS